MKGIKARKAQRGFSLLEILVVLVIMGILVSLVAPNVLNRVDDARIQKVHTDFKAITTALKMYQLDNFNYPSSDQGLQALVSKPSVSPEPKNWKQYLPELPIDPWGNPYKYIYPGEYGEFDIYTLGADNLAGGEDQNKDFYSGKKD
jgi:general secretion pathway protein G